MYVALDCCSHTKQKDHAQQLAQEACCGMHVSVPCWFPLPPLRYRPAHTAVQDVLTMDIRHNMCTLCAAVFCSAVGPWAMVRLLHSTTGYHTVVLLRHHNPKAEPCDVVLAVSTPRDHMGILVQHTCKCCHQADIFCGCLSRPTLCGCRQECNVCLRW